MKTYTKEELKEILAKHTKWLKSEEGGEKADLSYSNLRYSNLSGSDLRHSNLSYSDLSGSDLRYSDLRYSDLRYSDLRYSDLSYSNLRYSNLSGSDPRYSDLSYSNLSGSDLRGVDLIYFTFNRHTAYFVFGGKIRIGCEYHDIEWWQKNHAEVGSREKYTDTEISTYGQFIEMCAGLQKQKDASAKDEKGKQK